MGQNEILHLYTHSQYVASPPEKNKKTGTEKMVVLSMVTNYYCFHIIKKTGGIQQKTTFIITYNAV